MPPGRRKAIRQLDPHVVARVRSGVTATTFAQCAEELVMNSVDAGATTVEVKVGYSAVTY